MRIEQEKIARRPAWNTGRLIGPKPPPKPRHVWAIRTRLSMIIAYAISPCSTWRSTASREVATWFGFGSPISARRNGKTANLDHPAEDGPTSALRTDRADA